MHTSQKTGRQGPLCPGRAPRVLSPGSHGLENLGDCVALDMLECPEGFHQGDTFSTSVCCNHMWTSHPTTGTLCGCVAPNSRTRVQDSWGPGVWVLGHSRGHTHGRSAFTVIIGKNKVRGFPLTFRCFYTHKTPDAFTRGTLSPPEKGPGAPGSGDLQNGVQVTARLGCCSPPSTGVRKARKSPHLFPECCPHSPLVTEITGPQPSTTSLTTCRMRAYLERQSVSSSQLRDFGPTWVEG